MPSAALPSCSPAFPFGTTAPTTGASAPGPGAAHGVAPLTLWLGKEDVRANETHSMRVVEWLGAALEKRLARDPRARMSGIIVDTQGVTSADGRGRYAFLQHCIRTLKSEPIPLPRRTLPADRRTALVDTIIVLGHEKLNIELSRIFPTPESGIRVLKLPKSGGVRVHLREVRQGLADVALPGRRARQHIQGATAGPADSLVLLRRLREREPARRRRRGKQRHLARAR
jgi:polyribonucleotide 5'-hydroxyl-kinase